MYLFIIWNKKNILDKGLFHLEISRGVPTCLNIPHLLYHNDVFQYEELWKIVTLYITALFFCIFYLHN